jgi:hypothetical protein
VSVCECICGSSCDSCFMYLCSVRLIIGHCSAIKNVIRLNYVLLSGFTSLVRSFELLTHGILLLFGHAKVEG